MNIKKDKATRSQLERMAFDEQMLVANLIIQTVCDESKLSLDDLKKYDNRSQYVVPRQTACYLITVNTTLGGSHIGRLLSRDHSTVHHAVTTITDYFFTKDACLSLLLTVEVKLESLGVNIKRPFPRTDGPLGITNKVYLFNDKGDCVNPDTYNHDTKTQILIAKKGKHFLSGFRYHDEKGSLSQGASIHDYSFEKEESAKLAALDRLTEMINKRSRFCLDFNFPTAYALERVAA